MDDKCHVSLLSLYKANLNACCTRTRDRGAMVIIPVTTRTLFGSSNLFYYMANPVLGKSLCSDWFFLGQDFAIRTVSMGTVQSVYFCFGAKPANSTFATKTAKKKNCHSSHWNYQQKLKRLKFFRNFKDRWRRRTFFKCKPPEVHFTIRNRVPYNKLPTNLACLGRTGEYWPSVVFVRTSLC